MSKKNRRKKIQKLAMAGVLLALILVFLLVPIPSISGVSYAVIALIAVIIGCQFDGLLMGLFCGLAFGLASLIGSFTTGAGSLLAVAFHNPLISVFPRIMIPIACYFSYIGLRKLFKFLYSHRKKYNEKVANHLSMILSSGISAGIAVLTNTGLVMTLTYAFHAGEVLGGKEIGTALLWGIVVANSPLELVVCILVTPAVLIALKATFHQLNDKYSIKLPKLSTAISEEQLLLNENVETLNVDDENAMKSLDNASEYSTETNINVNIETDNASDTENNSDEISSENR